MQPQGNDRESWEGCGEKAAAHWNAAGYSRDQTAVAAQGSSDKELIAHMARVPYFAVVNKQAETKFSVCLTDEAEKPLTTVQSRVAFDTSDCTIARAERFTAPICLSLSLDPLQCSCFLEAGQSQP